MKLRGCARERWLFGGGLLIFGLWRLSTAVSELRRRPVLGDVLLGISLILLGVREMIPEQLSALRLFTGVVAIVAGGISLLLG